MASDLPSSLSLTALDACGQGLRADFLWQHDRWQHRIETVDGPLSMGVLCSLEGPPESRWPASPVLQNLHLEDRPDGGRVALLVGMAGTSHWSLSVEASANRAELIFDAACRVKEPPVWLGSTYRSIDAALPAALEDGEQSIAWQAAGIDLDLSAADGECPARLRSREESQTVIEVPIPTAPWPRTVRWSYRCRRR